MVGRRRPMRLMDEAFREAIEERVCHLFTILGTAGVGKSRLVDEFTESVRGQARVAMGRCLSYGHGVTFWPVAEALRHALGVEDGDATDVIDGSLRHAVGAEPESERIVAVVRGVLGIEDNPATTEETFWAVRKTFEALARAEPLILVFDDAHWGEPTFLDLVDHVTDWTRDAPILLIVMARPELLERRPGWGGGKRWVTAITLEPLSEEETGDLVTALLGKADLLPDLRTRISAAAEGNPLFVEELLGKLIDDGFLVTAQDAWSVSASPAAITIPATIHALLAARLDGLTTEDRAVIERGAVEGKVFHRGAVTELAPDAVRPHVSERLASLMRMELVRPDSASFAGDEAYRFRHLLIRDAAYQALAKQTRSDLHERFADWLERVAGDRKIEFQEIIGYHLEQAVRYRAELGLVDKTVDDLSADAARRLAAAGRRALGRGDMPASVTLLSRAIDLMHDAESDRADLLIDLADAQIEGGDFDGAVSSLSKAREVAASLQDEAFAAHVDVTQLKLDYLIVTTDYSDNLRHELDRLIPLFERSNDSRGLARAWTLKALLGVVLCRAADTEMAARKAFEYARDAGDIRLKSYNVWWLLASCFLGSSTPKQTLQRCDEVEAEWSGESRQTQAMILLSRGLANGMLGNFNEALKLHDEGRAILADLGLTILYGATSMGVDWIRSASGDYEASERALREGMEILERAGEKGYLSTTAGQLADVLYWRKRKGTRRRRERLPRRMMSRPRASGARCRPRCSPAAGTSTMQ
jgi:tetratricopeptide (TPR) repeat protein